jgi:hypothetical protein
MNTDQLINLLDNAYPYQVDSLEQVFGKKFVEYESTNDRLQLFKTDNVILDDGVKIEAVTLTLVKSNNESMLTLDLAAESSCISLSSIKEKYKNLEITHVPGGRSLEESTIFTTEDAKSRKLSFGFKVKRPDCLGMIEFGEI